MSDKGKKWFLAICIAVPFLVYCVYYYGIMIKNAPYKFSEFESITLKYGLGTDLVNQYNSKTGEYQYINERDSLVKKKVKLSNDDLLYLHRKAADLGFWNFPEKIEGRVDPERPVTSPHYYLEYKYERKDKHVLFDLNYSDDPKLHAAAKTLVDEVTKNDYRRRTAGQAELMPEAGRLIDRYFRNKLLILKYISYICTSLKNN